MSLERYKGRVEVDLSLKVYPPTIFLLKATLPKKLF